MKYLVAIGLTIVIIRGAYYLKDIFALLTEMDDEK